MWKILCPNQYVESVQQVDLDELKEHGLDGIIVDLDNTLVPWNESTILPEVKDWIIKAKSYGFGVCIVSNNNPGRGEVLSEAFEIPAVWKAVKPRRGAFRRALNILNLQACQVAVIGDQVFTDILGGNRLGLYTILVRPLQEREFFGTRLMRQLEKLILFYLKRRGNL